MEIVQTPNIEPGSRGRLVYDKQRRTIVAVQANPPHPLGFHIWRTRRGAPRFAQRIREAWWILSGFHPT